MAVNQDQNLLFGVFAVQLKKVTPSQIMVAAGAWAVDPSKELPDRLIEDSALTPADRDLIQGFVDYAVKAHDGDASATLAHFGGEATVHGAFRGSVVPPREGGISAAPSISTDVGSDTGHSVAGVKESPNRYTHKDGCFLAGPLVLLQRRCRFLRLQVLCRFAGQVAGDAWTRVQLVEGPPARFFRNAEKAKRGPA